MFSKIYNWWYGLGQYKEKIVDIEPTNEEKIKRLKTIKKLKDWAKALKSKKTIKENYDECDNPVKVEEVIKELEKEKYEDEIKQEQQMLFNENPAKYGIVNKELQREKKSYNLRKRNKKKKE